MCGVVGMCTYDVLCFIGLDDMYVTPLHATKHYVFYKKTLAHVKRLWRVQTQYLRVHVAWNKAVAILTREFPLFCFLIISRRYLCFTALSGVAFCFFSAMTNKFLITLSTHVTPLPARPG